MNNTRKQGLIGEQQAVAFLSRNGYEILEQNYRCGRNEVDIISLIDNRLLVFTEVKLRRNNHFGDPEQFVTEAQQDRIMEVAEDYVEAINWTKDIRFDIIAINDSTGELRHFVDAFF